MGLTAMQFRMLIGFVYGVNCYAVQNADRLRLLDYCYAIQNADRFNLLNDVYQLRMIRIQRLFLPPSKRAIFLATFTLDNLKIGKSTLDLQHVKIAPYEISCYMAQTQPQKA